MGVDFAREVELMGERYVVGLLVSEANGGALAVDVESLQTAQRWTGKRTFGLLLS